VDDSTPEDNSQIHSMFRIVAVMKDKPWEEVKVIIDGLRPGLVALRWEWGIHLEVPAGTVSYSYQRNQVFR
jgi:hypothetical protein